MKPRVNRELLALLVFLINLTSARGEITGLNTGDLIFQAEGNSSFSKAIAESTAWEDSLRIVHVGFLCIKDNEEIKVIEANPEEGVWETTLSDFLEHSPKIKDKPGVIVKRINKNFPADKILERAGKYMGEPYDWWYLPDNGKMYCSELVQTVFLDEEGNTLFSSKPMNFKDKDGKIPEFWIGLFEELGMDVPQGVKGTNPQDIFNDSLLFEVMRFF